MVYLGKELEERQRAYRVVTIVMFAVAVLTLVMRILVGLLPESLPDLAVDAIFSTVVQIGVFLALPFLAYKFLLGKNVKEIAEFSNIRKIKWYYIVLAVGVGFCAFIATIGISSIWQALIASTGYIHSSSSTVYPETFNVGMFIAEMALTALLPGFCEEFLIRGGVLTTMRGSYRYIAVLWIMAAVFGLFHQNITQVFYTACFGMLMAFLTIKLGSIIPAMVIHFVNNGMSVYMSYADEYSWRLGGGFYDAIDNGLMTNPGSIFGVYILIVLIGAGLVVLMLFLKNREKLGKQKEVILDSGFDQTNGRVVMFGEENKKFVEDIGMEKMVYGKDYAPDALYRPTVRDNAFLVGATVVTVLSTFATYLWGLM
ncbi:MAG: CPBP family intramembrane metalloprotease [Clostridia bacterium]|nr:CPBP family intramembrane metalloprotease [Clostridia bacterium]